MGWPLTDTCGFVEMRSAYILVRKPEGQDHLDLKDYFLLLLKVKLSLQ
jgi:hypothetical protein